MMMVSGTPDDRARIQRPNGTYRRNTRTMSATATMIKPVKISGKYMLLSSICVDQVQFSYENVQSLYLLDKNAASFNLFYADSGTSFDIFSRADNIDPVSINQHNACRTKHRLSNPCFMEILMHIRRFICTQIIMKHQRRTRNAPLSR